MTVEVCSVLSAYTEINFCFTEIQLSHLLLHWSDAMILNTPCTLTTSVVFTHSSQLDLKCPLSALGEPWCRKQVPNLISIQYTQEESSRHLHL